MAGRSALRSSRICPQADMLAKPSSSRQYRSWGTETSTVSIWTGNTLRGATIRRTSCCFSKVSLLQHIQNHTKHEQKKFQAGIFTSHPLSCNVKIEQSSADCVRYILILEYRVPFSVYEHTRIQDVRFQKLKQIAQVKVDVNIIINLYYI